MFDELQRQLRKLEKGVNLPIQVAVDEDGYFDRACPSSNCGRLFKVLMEDWKDRDQADLVYCPNCKHAAGSDKWCTPDQKTYINKHAKSHLKNVIGKAMRTDARRFNSRQKPGFVSIRINVRSSSHMIVLPIEAAELMWQRYECDECGCRFASIGAAFFCPFCGHNSAIRDFDSTIGTVLRLVSGMDGVKKSLGEQYGQDTAADSERMILESSIEKLSTALQRVSESLFDTLTNAGDFKWDPNCFQRLDDASDLWKDATGKCYLDFLSDSEFRELKTYVQKRHKIGHKQAIVDEAYESRSGDDSYQSGQRLVISSMQVRLFAAMVVKLVDGLKSLIPQKI